MRPHRWRRTRPCSDASHVPRPAATADSRSAPGDPAQTTAGGVHAALVVTPHTTIGECAGQPVRDYGPARLGPPARLHGTSRGPDGIDARQPSLRHGRHIPHAHRGHRPVGGHGVPQWCPDVTATSDGGTFAVTSQETRVAVAGLERSSSLTTISVARQSGIQTAEGAIPTVEPIPNGVVCHCYVHSQQHQTSRRPYS
jgi:hypothetical protein